MSYLCCLLRGLTVIFCCCLYFFWFLKKGTFEFIITLLRAVLTVVWSCTVLLRRAARCEVSALVTVHMWVLTLAMFDVCVFQVQDWQEQMVFPEAAILIFAWLNVNKMKNKISVYVLKWENEKAPVCTHAHSHMLTGTHSRTPTPVDRQWQISSLSDWIRNHPSSKHWFTTSFLQPLPYLVTS